MVLASNPLAAAPGAPGAAPEAGPALAPISLRRNVAWTFVGNVVYSGCLWGVLVVLSKVGSAEMIGQYVLGLAICAPVLAFCNLALAPVLATDARRDFEFADYLGLRLVTTLIAVAAIPAIALAAVHRREALLVALAVALAQAFDAVSDIYYGLFQQQERMDLVATSRMLKGVLGLGLLGAGVWVTGRLLWGVAGSGGAAALVLAGYDIPRGARLQRALGVGRRRGRAAASAGGRPRGEAARLRTLAWLAIPLGFAMALHSLNYNMPRYFVERYCGERELGIFAALAGLLAVGYAVTDALGAAASPRLAKSYAAGDGRAFRRLLVRLAGLGALVGAGGILAAAVAARPLLLLLYRAEYAERAGLLVGLMAVGAVAYVTSLLSYGMTAARYFRVQPFLLAACAAVSAGLCLVLVPAHGLWGAVAAMAAAFGLKFVGTLSCDVHALRALRRRAAEGCDGDA